MFQSNVTSVDVDSLCIEYNVAVVILMYVWSKNSPRSAPQSGSNGYAPSLLFPLQFISRKLVHDLCCIIICRDIDVFDLVLLDRKKIYRVSGYREKYFYVLLFICVNRCIVVYFYVPLL